MPSKSDKLEISHLKLPIELRQELSKPKGELIVGDQQTTTSELIRRAEKVSPFLIAVGDVCSRLLIEQGYSPDIIITDGRTKRMELSNAFTLMDYKVIDAECPAGEITREAWKNIRMLSEEMRSRMHLRISGEEDLLVLPILAEFQPGVWVVYGQPDVGVVLRVVDVEAQEFANSILGSMIRVS